jgi:hypothetical protein
MAIEPELSAAASSSAAAPAADGVELAAACAITAGHPVPHGSFRLLRLASKNAPPPALHPATAVVDALAAVVPPPFALVVFVSASTLPLVEALHADPRTRNSLRVGVTGWRLDPDYTLAQKLVDSRKLHYHEHGKTLERVLCQRLEKMVRAQAMAAAASPVPAVEPPATTLEPEVPRTPEPNAPSTANPRSETL